MLCGLLSPYDPLPPDALSQAKDNLGERFAYVGTTERFDEFLAFLNLELGWPTVAYKRSNLNRERPRRDELPADVLQIVEERNALDRELHAYAGDLLAGSLERAGPELAREVEVLRRAEKQRGGAPVLDRSWPIEARVALALEEGELAQADLRIKRLKRALKFRGRAARPS